MDLLGLFFWSFLAATIVPLGWEPALAVIVSRRDAIRAARRCGLMARVRTFCVAEGPHPREANETNQ